MNNSIVVAPDALILMMGASGSGKSYFAQQQFASHEIVSSDDLRERISGNAADQECSKDAFVLVHQLVDMRLKRGLLTVVDATNGSESARRSLLAIAAKHKRPVYAIKMEATLDECVKANEQRKRQVPREVIIRQLLLQEGAQLGQEYVTIGVSSRNNPLTVLRDSACPVITAPGFDIVGDLHGCFNEYQAMLAKLGYRETPEGILEHPDGRRLVLVGDLTDRGPDSVKVLEHVIRHRTILVVRGNHDDKLRRALKGNDVKRVNGLEETMKQLEAATTLEFRQETLKYLSSLPYQLQLVATDGSVAWVCHAGMPRQYAGKPGSNVEQMCLYGEITGQFKDGYPVRGTDYVNTWPAEGDVLVHGHTVSVSHPFPEFRVVNVDAGCAWSGVLRAYQHPEANIVTVTAGVEEPTCHIS